jgi:hypothetical protein
MIAFVPYEPHHFAAVRLPPEQHRWRELVLKPGFAESLVAPGRAWTGIVDGAVVGCAGLALQWENYAKAWALLGVGATRQWPAIVRKMKTVLADAGIRRIEADVADGFGNGCRLASLLGFKVEGIREAYTPDGRDHFLYARVTP